MKAKQQPKPALATVGQTPGPTLEKFIDESTPTNEYSLHWEAWVGQEDACQIHVELTASEYQDLLQHLGELRGYAPAVVKAA